MSVNEPKPGRKVLHSTRRAERDIAAAPRAQRRDLVLLAFFVLISLLAYYPAWHGGMLWDDDAHITRLELRSLQGLWRIWFEPGATQQYYPIAHSAFWLQARLWGDQVLGYHLANISLHALSAFLVVVIMRRLALPGAVLAGVVFALHPVQVESVAWMTELKNTLSGALYLGALLAYLGFDRSRRRQRYALAMVLFVLALLSKTVTATLPAALLVVFWWQRGTLSWRHDVRPLVPFFLLGAAGGATTVWVERMFIGARGAEFSFSVAERILVAGRAFVFYLRQLLWPANLLFVYPRWDIDAGALLQVPLSSGRRRTPIRGVAPPRTHARAAGRSPVLRDHARAGPRLRQRLPVQVLVRRGSLSVPRQPGHHRERRGRAGRTARPSERPVAGACAVGRRARGRPDARRADMAAEPPLCRRRHPLPRDVAAQSPGVADAPEPRCPGGSQLRRCPSRGGSAFQGRAGDPLRRGPVAQQPRTTWALMGRHAEALEEHRAAVRLAPGYAEAYLNLGTDLGHLDRYEEAAEAYRTALDIKPGLATASYDSRCGALAVGAARGGHLTSPRGAETAARLSRRPPRARRPRQRKAAGDGTGRSCRDHDRSGRSGACESGDDARLGQQTRGGGHRVRAGTRVESRRETRGRSSTTWASRSQGSAASTRRPRDFGRRCG